MDRQNSQEAAGLRECQCEERSHRRPSSRHPWAWLLVALLAGCGRDAPATAPTIAQSTPAAPAPPAAQVAPSLVQREPRRIGWGDDAPLANFPKSPARDLEAELAKGIAAGLHRIDGKHLTLLTDLPIDPEIERLPEAFDLAFPQWCDYFGVDPVKNASWRVTGYLVGNQERFAAAGLFPADLPAFKHGYSRGKEFWLYEQPNPYYRRHLLLHEGTHSFMFSLLGSGGPPWYSEGLAELMATHRWDAQGLKLHSFPKSREEVPELGRIKLVQDSLAAGQAFQLAQILKFGPEAHQQNAGYAWCWAMAAFLDGHPRYRDRFRQLPSQLNSLDFNGQFLELYQDDLALLNEEWQVFVAHLEHAYEFDRMIVDFTPGKALPAADTTLEVAADQGWRNSGWQLNAGETYRLQATGRYQLGTEPVIWWSEPGGVSIRYYHSEPLGKLLAAVRPDGEPANGRSVFLSPIAVGLEGTIRPTQNGTLYLRINDSAGELADNQGAAEVSIDRSNETR